MKKGKVLTGGQLALVAMVLVLGGAVWLNATYSEKLSGKTRYLGEAMLVDAATGGEAVPTAAQAQTSDYFASAQANRAAAYSEAEAAAQEVLERADASSEEKQAAVSVFAALSKRRVDESSAEELLKAKGFERTLVIIGDGGVTVILQKESLSAAETLQVQDVITAQCGVNPGNLKIVTVDG